MTKSMKHSFLALLAIISLLFACNQKDPNAMAFGESVDTTKAISATELTAKMSGNATFDGTISGKIENVCKAEGCWIKMSMGTEEPLMDKHITILYLSRNFAIMPKTKVPVRMKLQPSRNLNLN